MARCVVTVLRDVSLFQALFWLLMVILSQETMSVFVGNNNRMSSSLKIPGIWPLRYSVHVFPGKMVSLAYYWLLTGGYKGEKMYEQCFWACLRWQCILTVWEAKEFGSIEGAWDFEDREVLERTETLGWHSWQITYPSHRNSWKC